MDKFLDCQVVISVICFPDETVCVPRRRDQSHREVPLPAPALDAPLHLPEFYVGSPHDTYRWLRAEDPVHRHSYDGGWFWALTRHSDVALVSSSPDRFSSAQGVLMRGPLTDPINALTAGSVIASDPPAHRDVRRVVRHLFTPAAAARLEDSVRGEIKRLLETVQRGEPFDLVERVAARIPTFVTGEVLGIPPEGRQEFQDLVDATVAYLDPDSEFESVGADALGRAFTYLGDLVARRRDEPGDDLVSALLDRAEPDDLAHVRDVFVFLAGGTDTARTLISQGVLALHNHPEQLGMLRAHPELLLDAVEEMLRWVSPVNYFARVATETIELHGRTISAGDQVVMFYPSANRDEEVFGEDADDFRIDRGSQQHLAFGFGEHFCVGAHVARMQVRLFFEAFLGRFSSFELAGEPARARVTHINGLDRLPLTVS